MTPPPPDDAWDQAVRRRLQRLGAVDPPTGQLGQRIRAAMDAADVTDADETPSRGPMRSGPFPLRRKWLAAAAAAAAASVAALLALGLGIGVLTLGTTPPAVAAPAEAYALFREVVDRTHPVLPAENPAEVQRLAAAAGGGFPATPTQIDAVVRGWCVCQTRGTAVSCVLLDVDGHAVVLMIANAAEMRFSSDAHGMPPAARTSSTPPAAMVHRDIGDVSLCLMSQSLSTEKLERIAHSIVF